MDRVRLSVDGPVAVVTIDRPEVRNAVDPQTAVELRAAFEQVWADDAIRAAVLTGLPAAALCAPVTTSRPLAAAGRDPAVLDTLGPDREGPMGPTRSIPRKPVIAAVEGRIPWPGAWNWRCGATWVVAAF